MSRTKVMPTEFHNDDQSVKHKLYYLRMDGLDEAGFPSLRIGGGVRGRVDGLTGILPETIKNCPSLSRADVVGGFSADEKAAGKLFLAACERELTAKMDELKDEDYDDTDVFS